VWDPEGQRRQNSEWVQTGAQADHQADHQATTEASAAGVPTEAQAAHQATTEASAAGVQTEAARRAIVVEDQTEAECRPTEERPGTGSLAGGHHDLSVVHSMAQVR
jgi:hypothetical protein